MNGEKGTSRYGLYAPVTINEGQYFLQSTNMTCDQWSAQDLNTKQWGATLSIIQRYDLRGRSQDEIRGMRDNLIRAVDAYCLGQLRSSGTYVSPQDSATRVRAPLDIGKQTGGTTIKSSGALSPAVQSGLWLAGGIAVGYVAARMMSKRR